MPTSAWGKSTATPSRHHDRVWHDAHEPMVISEDPLRKEMTTRGDEHVEHKARAPAMAMPGVSGVRSPALSDELVTISRGQPPSVSPARRAG